MIYLVKAHVLEPPQQEVMKWLSEHIDTHKIAIYNS